MAFLFIMENFYLLVVLYEALKPITDFRSNLLSGASICSGFFESFKQNTKQGLKASLNSKTKFEIYSKNVKF